MTEHKLLTALAALGVALPGTVRAEDPPVETQIVDALNKTFGAHAGYRANHAKGVVVEGSFKASPAAATLSRASLFDGSTIAVTVRFSDSTGYPTCRTDLTWQTRMVWRSSTTCRTAAIPTW